MKAISKYKFKAALHSYKGWAGNENGIDDEIEQIIQKSKKRYVYIDIYDVCAVAEKEIDGEFVIELLLNTGYVIILCEERINDIIDFWISATESTTETKTET